MIIKGKFQGSMYTLDDDQLRQLLNAANYRGLHGVAQALKRERTRRLRLMQESACIMQDASVMG